MFGAAQTPSVVPPGTVVPFRFASIPTGWLELDGSTKNYNDFPVLGALYGGTPGGTFALDDWRGIPIFGADGSNAAGSITGSDNVDLTHNHAVGTLANAAAADHTHGVGTLATASNGSHSHGGTTGTHTATQMITGGVVNAVSISHNHTISSDGAHTHTLSGDSASGGAHNHTISGSSANALASTDKRPRRAYAKWIIKT